MRQLHPHLPDLENINHLVELIAVKTPLHVSFVTRVRALNEMWNRILQTTNEREVLCFRSFLSPARALLRYKTQTSFRNKHNSLFIHLNAIDRWH